MKTASTLPHLVNRLTHSTLAAALLAMVAMPTAAQNITAAQDGTGTTITHHGNTYAIGGGTQAGANLFHSFQDFGLSSNEIANFLSNPNIENVFGRVVGGNPSVIEGLIRLSGGNANLYLMNPAGLVFGQGARLDVPGSFTATTATRIGFNEGFFNADGENDYAALTGNPTGFIFDNETGMILNEADLAVAEDQSLWLVGNSVLSTGTLAAANGNVTIAAIPGSNQIRISQDGMLLSLVLDAAPAGAGDLPNQMGIQATDLPRYLTGDAELEQFESGDVGIAGAVEAETVQLMAAGQVTPTDVNLVQGDTTVVRFPGADGKNVLSIIDAHADNAQDLLFSGAAGTIATIIQDTESGISAISEQLAVISESGYQLDGMSITAEGNVGNFWLGNTWITHETVQNYQAQLAEWSSAFTASADLLLYSCFTALGATGEALMASLATGTGLDVAASTNATGSANHSGDWLLESSTGSIETQNPFTNETLANWDGKLATFTVENGNDSGADSLRDEISNANGSAGADEIRFANGVTLVDLTSGELSITEELTITGGSTNVTVQRNAGAATDFRIFDVTGGVETTFDNLTLTNGKISDRGGGIQSNGVVNLISSTVTGNSSSDRGGGIYTNRAVTLTDSTVSGNSSNQYGGGVATRSQITASNSTISGNFSRRNGAGLYSRSGNITLTNSTVSSNSSNRHGGGVWARSRTITLSNSTVSGNSSRISAAGMYSQTAHITNSVVTNNSSGDLGGGVYATGTTTLTNSTIAGNTSNNKGGGIYFRNHLTVENSTISGNVSNRGGGIYSRGGGTVTLTNTTLSGNSSSDRGGGIFLRGRSGGTTSMFNSTIANNTASLDGGGIFRNGGTVNLTNTIVATNIAYRSGNDLSGTFNTIESSLIGDTAGATITTSTNNLTNLDPRLLPLGNYGGSTQTHALHAESPARNAGNNALTVVANDQRGAARIWFGTVDIGAVEFFPVESSNVTLSVAARADFETQVEPLMEACETIPEVEIAGLDSAGAAGVATDEPAERDAACQPSGG
ncbi:MAG: DUF4347 domain-containing protein [Cyanobacteria bacterium P01_G01_bin.54]